MAGYCGYSKSNNAIYAEENLVFPASILSKKLKVTTEAIKSLLSPCEWHHTSSWYNSVDYYDGSLLIPLSHNEIPDFCDEDDLFEAAEILLNLRSYRSPKKTGWIDEDCTVEWIEWSGSRRRPKAIEHREEHCKVEFNGRSTHKITTPSGYIFSKREGANGFHVYRIKNNVDS